MKAVESEFRLFSGRIPHVLFLSPYLRLIDFVYHSTLDLRVMKKREKFRIRAPRI